MALFQDNSEVFPPPTYAGNGVLLEDDKPVLPDLPIRAATLTELVRLVVNALDHNGDPKHGVAALPKVVFQMHRWFTSSASLVEQMMLLHKRAGEISPCSIPGCSHAHNANASEVCELLEYQTRVCHAIRYWILQFPMHFDMENGLAGALREFQSALTPTSAELVDLSQVPSYDWMRHVSVRNNSLLEKQSSLNKQHSRKVSLVFNNLEPIQLAEHITYLEHKVIRRITFHDLKKYADTTSLRDTPRLERSVMMFNGLTQWIQCMVLCRTTPQQRADIIEKFIYVAMKLLELQNFNSLMAVVGSVGHSVLARLSKTMACLSGESKKLLFDLTDMLSSNNNFSNYRRRLAECKGFKIPILGIHLKDLISLHVALPDVIEGNMINVRKMAQLSLIFQELEELQNSTPPIDANMDLVNTLRLSLDLSYTEDEIYELSLAREPRNTSSPQISPTQSVLFAEWASSPCPPPDPQTIEKHVNAMVEAVFKNYDNDRDGYISHEEFDAVAGNFPFIASFCVLDADHDGMISQEEMKKYFIHANCHALKSGFKHDFHETTYFKPTYCSHCRGLLWGLIRQGYKCKDCGINSHKHCKELVVMECRQWVNPPTTAEPSSHAATSRRKFRRKKKSSASESESSPPSPKFSTNSYSSIGDSESYQQTTSGAEHSDSGGGSLPPSPKPTVMWAGPRRKISDSLLVPSRSRTTRLRPQQSCPESTCTHNCRTQDGQSHSHPPPLLHSSTVYYPPLAHQSSIHSLSTSSMATSSTVSTTASSISHSTCICHSEQLELLTQKLAAAEEAKERLAKENQFLLQQLEVAYKELHSLRDHVGEVRQQTVAFILRQMETLHIQKDTHV